MPALPRFAIDALQKLGSTRIGGALESEAFLAFARAAARDFARVRGVRAVYLTGSWTRPKGAAPGFSDVDFMIAVDVPTLRDELTLRAGLHATQKRWNTLATVFKHVDYFEARDFDCLIRGGAVFWCNADDRFVALAGASALSPGRRPHLHQSTERTLSVLRRWSRVSQVLIDPSFVRADVLTRRAAKRLLAGVIADCLHVNANEPGDELIARGLRELDVLASFRPPSESVDTRRFALEHTVAALRVTEEACRRHVAQFPRERPQSPPAPYAPDRFDASARRVGFDGGVVTPLAPPGDPALAFVLTSEDPGAAVERLHRSFGDLDLPEHTGFELRPSLVTRAMWPACALLSPTPEVGEALGGIDTAWGRLAPPTERDRAAIAMGRMLDLFVRPRGRAFRTDRSPRVTLAMLGADVHRAAPRIRAYRRGEPLGPIPPIPEDLEEVELLERLRAILAEERPLARRALGLPPA